MSKPFNTPFAENGDVMFIPEEAQADGSVSYETGFGPDYSADPLEANAKPVPRAGHNELFNQITSSIGDIQRQGFANWYEEFAQDGGYPKKAIVWHLADSWQSQIDGNASEPGPDELTWLSSEQYQGGGGSDGGFGLNGPTTVNVGGSYQYTIEPYTSFLTYSASATNGAASVSGKTVTLVISSGETANVTDLTVTRSDGAVTSARIAIGAQSIATPAILAPTQGATDVALGPNLTASAFATYPAGADTHLNTDWRIRTMAGAVVWQSLANAVSKTSIKVPENTLPLNTQLQVDVRYRGTTLPVSAYSPAVTFTTTNQSITTPSITSPLNGATGIGRTPTITATAFATNPLGADTHASSDWQLKNSGGAVIWSSIANTIDKTSITIPSGVLSVSSQYTIEVRYNGTVLQPSPWSPVVSFTTAAVFAYDRYMVVTAGSTANLVIYGQDVDTFTKLADPATLPAGQAQGPAFSADGLYLSFAQTSTPFLTVYKRAADVFTRLANPASLPLGVTSDTAFTVDSLYLAVAQTNNPYLSVYKRSGDTFTKLAAPAAIPSNISQGVAFSADTNYLAVAHDTSPYLTIYKRSGDTFTKVANPATLPTGTGFGVAFSPDGVYLVIAHAITPFFSVYKRSGDTFTKLANSAALPTGRAYRAAFSPDGNYMAVAHEVSPYLSIYKRSGDTFTKLANPAVLPTGIGRGVAFTADGLYLSVSHITTPSVTTYKRSGDTFTKLANPSALPAGDGLGIAVYPPVPGV